MLGPEVIELDDNWQYASTVAGAAAVDDRAWSDVGRRTTAAGARRHMGTWSLDDHEPTDFDEHDHCFRRQVALAPTAPAERLTLELDGLATIGDVYWNDALVASTTSMFAALAIDVTELVEATNEVRIHCRSLHQWLETHKAPRARWKTKLVTDQRLRAVRTTLLGRIPSWSPPVVVVGPWRPVRIVRHRGIVVEAVRTQQRDDSLVVAIRVAHLGSRIITGGAVHFGERTSSLTATMSEGADDSSTVTLTGTVSTSGLARWWPHTHGDPALHPLSLRLDAGDFASVDIDLGRTGVRSIDVDHGPDGHGFGLRINGEPVFCRGGSVMPLDVATFMASTDELRTLLGVARDAGCNMVRVSGTAAYEQPAFFDVCDELGILVWHDLPFANFDYPRDPDFTIAVQAEVTAFLQRTERSPSLAVVCGGSEIEQQAAMVGLAQNVITDSLARTVIREVVDACQPGLVYVASSPSGGHLPFSNDEGVNHYFGVGAYRRPLSDARHASVRFASECLAFANVPVPATVAALLGEHDTAPTTPRWKERVPRDRGTGWDFDDVRDHYVHELFGIDPVALRFADPTRYLAVGRAASAEILKRVFAEWRRPGSTCRGALVWTLNDLWAGAGWGLIDAHGRAKAALHGMASVLQPVALLAIDEGLNGLDLWACNDGGTALIGRIEVRAFRDGRVVVAEGVVDVVIPARGAARVRADEAFGRFTDPTYAYRFGPAGHDIIAARLVDQTGEVVGRATYVPSTHALTIDPGVGLTATAGWVSDEILGIEVASAHAARFVTVEAQGGRQLVDHVDVMPGDPQLLPVRFRPDKAVPARIYVSALNVDNEISVTVPGRRQ